MNTRVLVESKPHTNTNAPGQEAALPRHVAIIMDGNGRWAQERGLPRHAGHEAALRAVRETVRTCGELRIPVLTLYVFSTENWSRPRAEVDFLMGLLVRYLRSELDELYESNVRLRLFGDLGGLPVRVRRELEIALERTRDNTGLDLGLAFNYGGRQDITQAVRQLAREVERGSLRPTDITPELIQSRLYTADLPEPDLIIRTGGELRLSNFLLWQAAYSEFWWTTTYWPDFDRARLLQALSDFQHRQRRFGALASSDARRKKTPGGKNNEQ